MKRCGRQIETHLKYKVCDFKQNVTGSKKDHHYDVFNEMAQDSGLTDDIVHFIGKPVENIWLANVS